MKQYVEIGGRSFEVKKGTYNPQYAGRTLSDCYGRASRTKEAIWHDWSLWFHRMDSSTYGVTSYNAHFFTIGGVIMYNDVLCGVSITASHNIIYVED